MRTLQTFIRSCAPLVLALALLLCAGCNTNVKHCFLCGGIPREAPCVVDLATGDIAELSTDSIDGAMSWQFVGSLHVTQMPGTASVDIPAETQNVNTELFCDDCLAAIEDVSNKGYVLADLNDLDNIRLFGIEDGMCFSMRQYDVSVIGEMTSQNLIIEVR